MVDVMADRLRSALGRDEFRLVYQPLVSLPDGTIDAFEALLRWTHRGAPVPLEVYIPVAEKTGLIHRIGEWVLATACRQMHALNRAYPARPPSRVHVNVSGYQLDVDGWHRQVAQALRHSGLPPEHLVLELTEGRYTGNDARMRRQLTEAAMLGAEIAVDAFGAGYSTLAYLPQMPLHVIKVDRLFVQRLEDDPVASALIRSLSRLTGDLAIRCIAEGVETTAQARALRGMGYTHAQGYLFSRPLEYEAILADLPAVELATSRAAAGLAGADGPTVPPPRVLVVDEDDQHLRAMSRALGQRPRLQVSALGDHAEAVEMLHRNEALDMVVIALATRPEPGIRLARAVRSTCRGRAIPVLAVAGPAGAPGGADARLFDQVITAPVDPEVFTAAVCGWIPDGRRGEGQDDPVTPGRDGIKAGDQG